MSSLDDLRGNNAERTFNEQKGGHIPVSTMSLIMFRQQRPALYWPVSDRSHQEPKRVLNTVHETNPDLRFMGESPKKKHWIAETKKTAIYAGRFLREDGTEEYVAVKSVQLSNQEYSRQVAEEVQKLTKIDHVHIIAALGSFQESYFSHQPTFGILLFPLAQCHMETYLEWFGSDREKTGWVVEEAVKLLSYFACLCSAVIYLHELPEPIIHRDIKLQNILVDSANQMILADFDISKQYAKDLDVHSEGPSDGTRRFHSPAVACGDRRSYGRDVFTLGVVFLQMATVAFGKDLGTLNDRINMLGGGWASFASESCADDWINDHKAECGRDRRLHWPQLRFEEVSEDSDCRFLDIFFAQILEMLHTKLSEGDEQDRLAARRVLRKAYDCFVKIQRQQCHHCNLKPPPFDRGAGIPSTIDEHVPEKQRNLSVPGQGETKMGQARILRHRSQESTEAIEATGTALPGFVLSPPEDATEGASRTDDETKAETPRAGMNAYARPSRSNSELGLNNHLEPASDPLAMDWESEGGVSSVILPALKDVSPLVFVYENSECHVQRRRYLRRKYCRWRYSWLCNENL